MLPIALFDVLQTGFVCLGAFVLVAVAVPFILPVFVALLIAFYYFRWFLQQQQQQQPLPCYNNVSAEVWQTVTFLCHVMTCLCAGDVC
jgi:hypothetical protein